MRQPPRQPPRQQPKPAAKRQAPRSAPKSDASAKSSGTGNTSQKAQNTTNARNTREAQQRARAQQTSRTGQQSRRAQNARGQNRQRHGPLRGWRSWWATHEMDRRNNNRRGGRGTVGGGFTHLRNFGGARAAAVLTLLLLALFTSAIALGAQSIAAGFIAFLFFGGALAVVTAARAQYHFRMQPAETADPLEKVAEFRIDDLPDDDDFGDSEVNSLADLERSMEYTPSSDAPGSDAEPKKAVDSESTTPLAKPDESASKAEGADAESSKTVAAEAPAAAKVTELATDPVADKQTEPASEAAASPATKQDTVDETSAAESTPSGHEAAAAGPRTGAIPMPSGPSSDTPSRDEAAKDATDAAQAPVDVPQQSHSVENETEPRQESADGAIVLPAPRTPGDDHEAEDDDSDETDDDPQDPSEASDSESAEEDEDLAVLMAPLVEEDEDENEQPPKAGTSLSLLAAETPATAEYLGQNTSSLPPEAVRDVAATLIVADLSRSIMFYTEILGLVEIDRARDAVLLEAGFGRVLLWRRSDAPGAGDPVMHLTFEVGDIDTAYQTMRAKGVEFTHPPRAALSGEVHDLRAASFLDPDGHGLAITQLKEHPGR